MVNKTLHKRLIEQHEAHKTTHVSRIQYMYIFPVTHVMLICFDARLNGCRSYSETKI